MGDKMLVYGVIGLFILFLVVCCIIATVIVIRDIITERKGANHIPVSTKKKEKARKKALREDQQGSLMATACMAMGVLGGALVACSFLREPKNKKKACPSCGREF